MAFVCSQITSSTSLGCLNIIFSLSWCLTSSLTSLWCLTIFQQEFSARISRYECNLYVRCIVHTWSPKITHALIILHVISAYLLCFACFHSFLGCSYSLCCTLCFQFLLGFLGNCHLFMLCWASQHHGWVILVIASWSCDGNSVICKSLCMFLLFPILFVSLFHVSLFLFFQVLPGLCVPVSSQFLC